MNVVAIKFHNFKFNEGLPDNLHILKSLADEIKDEGNKLQNEKMANFKQFCSDFY